MKLLLCGLMVGAGLAAQEPGKLVTVPRGAVPVAAGLYRWTDPDGRDWMYRTTPFGVTRRAADAPHLKLQAIVASTGVIDHGDSIRFERATPFGKAGRGSQKSRAAPNGAEDLGAAPAGAPRRPARSVYGKRSSP
jgi:hypothetical protein